MKVNESMKMETVIGTISVRKHVWLLLQLIASDLPVWML